MMAKARKIITAKPASEADVLPPVTPEERKNGWNENSLDAYLRGVFDRNAYGYRQEILARWRETERMASDAVTAFKRDHGLADPSEKRTLEKMEIELANISAMVNRAATLLDNC